MPDSLQPDIPLKPWQFSLRAILIFITILCIVLATFGAEWWWWVYLGCSFSTLIGVTVFDVYVARYASLPDGHWLRSATAGSISIGFITSFLAASHWLSGSMESVHQSLVVISGPQFLLTPFLIWRAWIRRFGADQIPRLKVAAVLNLFTVAIAVIGNFALVNAFRAVSFRSHADAMRATNVTAFCASIAMSIPWIYVLRYRSEEERKPVPAGLFWSSLGFQLAGWSALVSWTAFSLISRFHWTPKQAGFGYLILLLHVLGGAWQVASLMFTADLLLKLIFGRWPGVFTAVGCILCLGFWTLAMADNDAPFRLALPPLPRGSTPSVK